MTYGPPCPFRATGRTWRAGLYPLSPSGQRIMAEHNGTTVEAMPWAFRFASNAYMHKWIEGLGELYQTTGIVPRYRDTNAWLPVEIFK